MSYTRKRERAAALVADDALTDEQIATEVGIGRATLTRWKRQAEFRAQVDALVAETHAQLLAEGIANKQNRLDALNDAHQRMEQVIAERAADPALADVPGGTTGLIVHTYRQVGWGAEAQLVDEYAVDTATLKERRATLQQAAQEVGEWTERKDVTTAGQPLNIMDALRVVAEERAQRERELPGGTDTGG